MIPRLSIFGTCISEFDAEFAGKTVQLRWLGFVFEVTIGRIERRFDD